MIKAVFFDFDDTLVSRKTHEMIESTKKAIELLHSKNIIPVMATGRPMYTIKKYIDELKIENGVFLNGHVSWANREVILDKKLGPEKIKHMFDIAEKYDFPYAVVSNEDTYLSCDVSDIGDVMVINGQYKAQKLQRTSDINGNLLWLFAKEAFDEKITSSAAEQGMRSLRWGEEGVDIISGDVSKKTGVKVLLEKLGIDFSEIMFFGDGDNDIELMEVAKIGVAMGNGTENLKKVSDYVTDDIEKDGIYNALVKLEII